MNAWKTLTANLRGGARGVPADWKHGSAIAKAFGPELVLTDFDGFAYLFAKLHRKPVFSVDNIQMVDRCRHDGEILKGIRRDHEMARAFVNRKIPSGQPLPDHDLLPAAAPEEGDDADPLAPPPGNPGGEV